MAGTSQQFFMLVLRHLFSAFFNHTAQPITPCPFKITCRFGSPRFSSKIQTFVSYPVILPQPDMNFNNFIGLWKNIHYVTNKRCYRLPLFYDIVGKRAMMRQAGTRAGDECRQTTL
jgi:hypothetical protein